METQNCPAEPSSPSTDPIATVRLWPVLVMALVAGTLGAILVPSSLAPDLREKAYGGAVFGSIIVWWLDCVAGATRRAGFQPWTRSAGAVLLVSLKVAVAVVLTRFVWVLLSGAVGLPPVGLVTGPTLRASEPTAQSLAVNLLVVALVAPVAEEMLFRGALFRKWRLRLGSGKAAVLTSVLFGLAHPSAPTSFLFALSMAVLYTTTRTIWAPVAAHVMNNFLSVTMAHSVHFMPLAVLEAVADW